MLSSFISKETVTDDTYTVEIDSGKILGFRERSSLPSAICFRGVPFATARRLENPQPVDSWKSTGRARRCLRFGPACPQPPLGMRFFTESIVALLIETIFYPLPRERSYYHGEMNEDCLNANVYTPGLNGSDDDDGTKQECKRPVLVWIHGGRFEIGSNIEGGFYNASSLAAKHGVVVVAINYRIGPFGFLHFHEHGITNLGIRDQIAGLRWVRENAAFFGGDPSNVTIIGESAGAMSVGTLLGCPRAEGLFHRAVLMSGGTSVSHTDGQWKHFFGAFENATPVRDEIRKTGHRRITPESFKSLPVNSITNIMGKMLFSPVHQKTLGTNGMFWQPYQDGDIVPKGGGSRNSVSAKTFRIPILTGVCNDEHKLFEFMLPKIKNKEHAVKHAVPSLRGYFKRTTKDDKELDGAKWENHAASLYEIVDSCRSKPGGSPLLPKDVFRAMLNIVSFEDPNFCLARNGGKRYGEKHVFSYNLHYLDSGHAYDAMLLFGFGYAGGYNIVGSSRDPTAEDWERASQFQKMIVSFARTGKPSVHTSTGSPIDWKAFPENMHLNGDSTVSRPFGEELTRFQALKKAIVSDLKLSDQ